LRARFEYELNLTNEALNAAQILADMQSEEILFDKPPSPTDGQPPATFPKANEQFSSLPPPMADVSTLSPADKAYLKASERNSLSLPPTTVDRNTSSPSMPPSSQPSTSVSFPDATSARDLASRRAHARAVSAPFSEYSELPANEAPGDSMPGDRPANASELAERQAGDLARARVHGETRTCRDPYKWSERARQKFEDWVLEEEDEANLRWNFENLWQARHAMFLRSFYNRESEVTSLPPEEDRSRRNSAPAGDCPPPDLSALTSFFKMHQRWKEFCSTLLVKGKGKVKAPELPDFYDRLRRLGMLDPSSDPSSSSFELETDPNRLRHIEELQASNEEMRRALADGGHRYLGKVVELGNAWSQVSALQDHGDDDSSQMTTPAKKKKKKNKNSKRKSAPSKTKQELTEEVQARIAAQSQSEQQASESASSKPANNLPSTSRDGPAERLAQLCSDDNEPQASTSSIPQAANPKSSHGNTAPASHAQSEKAKAERKQRVLEKEQEKARKKAKAKAHRENKQAQKREAEDKKMALKLAQEEAERVELEEKKTLELQRQQRVAEEEKVFTALARQEREEAERLKLEDEKKKKEKEEKEEKEKEEEVDKKKKKKSELRRQRQKAEEDEAARAYDRLVSESAERRKLQLQIIEAEDRKTAMAIAQFKAKRAEIQEEEKRLLSRGLTVPEVVSECSGAGVEQEVAALEDQFPRVVEEVGEMHVDTSSVAQAEGSTSEASQGEQVTGREETGQMPEDFSASRPSSDAQALIVPQHATVSLPSDSFPPLPSSRPEGRIVEAPIRQA